ncbi:rnase p rpr2 rpp21 snm1 subunit domain-containing protein [Diplodia corticola]|uniref:Rnase p rpr2 rpp21 snm1 subunit domain-containing protein n=1 Tax=Diplodia corticola TaxID=236234 RepID=A0A1J9RYN3_9PEZI|nr:rnase p rpr2 rpp21 snm1 subunit domain-containing protein [Diplodia corticola]OJD37779.1 rnase p rpr2 rpp21 snm1 subunit domain-containing protein [Diplodia corticola]
MDRTAAEARDLSARLKHLDGAAHVLALASPETSSFLESQYSHLLAENDLNPPESRTREVCGACGTILIPGILCTVTQEQARPRKPKEKGSKVQKPEPSEAGKCYKMKTYSCLRCSSKTRLQVPSSKTRMGARKPAKATAVAMPPLTTAACTQTQAVESGAAVPAVAPASPAPAAANVSSKKRAKARKGGLQALLANSKKETKPANGFGLDLMDLMRSD